VCVCVCVCVCVLNRDVWLVHGADSITRINYSLVDRPSSHLSTSRLCVCRC